MRAAALLLLVACAKPARLVPGDGGFALRAGESVSFDGKPAWFARKIRQAPPGIFVVDKDCMAGEAYCFGDYPACRVTVICDVDGWR